MNHATITASSAEDVLRATLSAEQAALFDTYEQASADAWLHERDELVDGLARFLPGLEPAVRAYVALHQGCQPLLPTTAPALAPADATPAWPTDEEGGLAIDPRLELLAGLCNHLPAQRAALIAIADHIASAGHDWPQCCADVYPELKLSLL
jgi:hypothetical protein